MRDIDALFDGKIYLKFYLNINYIFISSEFDNYERLLILAGQNDGIQMKAGKF